MRVVPLGAIATLALLASPFAQAGTLLLKPGTVLSQQSSVGSSVRQVDSLPYQTNSDLTGLQGQSTAAYSLATSSFDVQLGHSSRVSRFTGSSAGQFVFSVSQSSFFSMDPTFGGLGGLAWGSYVDLVDVTTGQSLLARQQSGGLLVSPEGESGGDSGSLSGLLQSGHTYQLRYILTSIAGTEAAADSFGGAGIGFPTTVERLIDPDAFGQLNPSGRGSASGSIRFSLTSGEPAAVPLPAAVWSGMVLIGALGVGHLWGLRFRHRAGLN
jgi:hypothetical protein